jgi:hypothetical protein
MEVLFILPKCFIIRGIEQYMQYIVTKTLYCIYCSIPLIMKHFGRIKQYMQYIVTKTLADDSDAWKYVAIFFLQCCDTVGRHALR